MSKSYNFSRRCVQVLTLIHTSVRNSDKNVSPNFKIKKPTILPPQDMSVKVEEAFYLIECMICINGYDWPHHSGNASYVKHLYENTTFSPCQILFMYKLWLPFSFNILINYYYIGVSICVSS